MAGYSKTPLIKKLGIKADFNILILNAPDNYWQLMEELPEDIIISESPKDYHFDFIHFFSLSESHLNESIGSLKNHLKKEGMLWLSWPKKASKVPTDLNDMVVRNLGLSTGLVDVKVCAFDETWSALKFVFRKGDR